jgi:hypothetical protein
VTLRLQVTIDCANPMVLVPFWCRVLVYVVEPPPEGFASWNDYWRYLKVPEDELPVDHDAADSIVDPDGIGPRIWFQIVPEPKSVKNRVHLDVRASGGRGEPKPERVRRVEAHVRELEQIGARRLRTSTSPDDEVDHYGVVLADPEGNEFCVH